MTRILFALTLSFMLIESKAQSLKELKVGDTLPLVNVTYLDGEQVKQTTLSSLIKGKFVIIDFWATWCAACIKSMAEGDSIGKKFNGNFQMLPVTYEDKNTVRTFVRKNPILKNLNFHYVVGDSLLMGGYFKFTVLPHHVWVDSTGVVKSITYADQISYDNIAAFTSKKNLALEAKKDDIDFDMSKPFKTGDSAFLCRSLFTPYRLGLLNQMGTLAPAFDDEVKTNRFLAINKDMLSLFYAAYSCNNELLDLDRVELHVHDSIALSPFFVNNGHPPRNLIQKNCFCYELILPEKVTKRKLYDFVFDDLNRFSPYVATVEKRKRKCWVLINRDKSKNAVANDSKTSVSWKGGFLCKVYNKPMAYLLNYLGSRIKLPLVDESFCGNIGAMELQLDATDLIGETPYFNIEKVKNNLNTYGFDIIQTERNIDVLVIKQK